MIQHKVLICGLPESGKTTFLAALWYLLFNKEIHTELTLASLPKVRDYLNALAAKWSRTVQIDHTPTDEVQEINLKLTDGISELDLHVPDMSGETWGHLWSTRSCAEHAALWAKEASGIILFLHSDKIRLPLDIMTRNEMIGGDKEESGDTESSVWSPENSPTQAILVDILQGLALPPLGHASRRIAVIISAWDIAESTGLPPEEYLRVHLPLLYQFLQCSGHFDAVKIFGVSALGGDLHSPEDVEKLQAENIPSKRIKVVEGDKTFHDLTVPIQWLVAQ